MKNCIRKTAALWVAVLIFIAAVWCPAVFGAEKDENVTAYITAELLPVGKGFLCAPSAVKTEKDENAAQALLRFLAANGYAAYFAGTPEKDFRLAFIADGDKTDAYKGFTSSVKDWPVKEAAKIEIKGPFTTLTAALLETYGVKYVPAKDNIEGAGYIGDRTFVKTAGWIFTLNGEYVEGSLSDVTLKDGDVLRVQFSFADGADLGYKPGADGKMIRTGADTSGLIRLVTDHAQDSEKLASYNDAYALLQQLNPGQIAVDTAENTLAKEIKALEESETTTAKPQEPTTKKEEPTTRKPQETTTKKPQETTTKNPQETTTKKPQETTTKKQEPTTKKPVPTTKKQEPTTKKQEPTTRRQEPSTRYTPATTSPSTTARNIPYTTLYYVTTTTAETTTIERPEGLTLPRKATATDATATDATKTDAEESTTAADENATPTDAPGSLLDRLKNMDSMTKKIVTAAAIAVGIAIAVLIFRRKAKEII